MQMNAVTLVSDCLLFLAEQQAIMNDKISTNNVVVILTLDRIFKVLEVNVPSFHDCRSQMIAMAIVTG